MFYEFSIIGITRGHWGKPPRIQIHRIPKTE